MARPAALLEHIIRLALRLLEMHDLRGLDTGGLCLVRPRQNRNDQIDRLPFIKSESGHEERRGLDRIVNLPWISSRRQAVQVARQPVTLAGRRVTAPTGETFQKFLPAFKRRRTRDRIPGIFPPDQVSMRDGQSVRPAISTVTTDAAAACRVMRLVALEAPHPPRPGLVDRHQQKTHQHD
jgi:hypothetical protein